MREILPASTYRLELSKEFTLEDAAKTIPYLHELGIEMVYLSPYFENERGSSNLYKIVSSERVNPILGGEKGLHKFLKALERFNLLHMIDVVSNHMAATVDNPWWWDVLKQGEKSRYADFFDIDWKGGKGKIVCPFLHDDSEITKKRGELIVDGKGYPLKKGTESLPLKELLEKQNYTLCHWKEASKRINYRRFFDITDLVGLRMEEEKVYKRYHRKIFKWVGEHKVQGLRVDHPDGLYYPAYYLKRLSKNCPSIYLVCEKILQSNELMREDWKARGTVGYDALNTLNALFVQSSSEKEFDRIYRRFAKIRKDPGKWLVDIKRKYIRKYLRAEIKMIAKRIGKKYERALIEFLANFPIYRCYVTPEKKRIHRQDMEAIHTAIGKSKMDAKEKEFFGKTFLSMPYRHALLRTEQLMPAVFAKGFEDTFLYQYNRLVSLNEVGSTPTKFGITRDEFHEANQMRALKFPESMITTSTHDSKRSHDVRMRINVLSEIPKEWEGKLIEWRKINGPFIDCNMEYFLYQTLVGFWPDRPTKEIGDLKERLLSYMLKAAREAKSHTDWIDNNAPYEKELIRFIKRVMDNPHFWKSFYPFQEVINLFGMYNSFSSLILKMGMPGVVDFYQGEETWRYDLVDPDNRRRVDFSRCKKMLEGVQIENPPLEKWFQFPHDGKLKFYLLEKGLKLRKTEKELFLHGDYVPIAMDDDRTIAFLRKKGRQKALIMATRFYTSDVSIKPLPVKKGWVDIFTGSGSTPLPFSIQVPKEL